MPDSKKVVIDKIKPVWSDKKKLLTLLAVCANEFEKNVKDNKSWIEGNKDKPRVNEGELMEKHGSIGKYRFAIALLAK